MSHGVTGHVVDGVYRTKLDEKIKENKTVKDLKMFTEHIDDLVQLSKIKVGLLPRIFETKKSPDNDEDVHIIHIHSKLDYCSLIWSPPKKEDIDKIK